METFSALLAICPGNSLVTGEFPTQRPVTRSFDVFFDLRLNKLLSKQSWGWWFETLSHPLWRHCNVQMRRNAISYALRLAFINWPLSNAPLSHYHDNMAPCNHYVDIRVVAYPQTWREWWCNDDVWDSENDGLNKTFDRRNYFHPGTHVIDVIFQLP